MPLYEYKCEKCGHRFEKIESNSASVTKKCPKCGAKARRQLSAPAIQFKGTGWYVTDYGGKSSGAPSGEKSGENSGDSAPKKTEEKSADSKPAAEKTGGEKSTSKKGKK